MFRRAMKDKLFTGQSLFAVQERPTVINSLVAKGKEKNEDSHLLTYTRVKFKFINHIKLLTLYSVAKNWCAMHEVSELRE